VKIIDPLRNDQNRIENSTHNNLEEKFKHISGEFKIKEDLISFVEDPEDPFDEYAYPAAVLAQYENPDFSDESDIDQEDESPLYAERPDF